MNEKFRQDYKEEAKILTRRSFLRGAGATLAAAVTADIASSKKVEAAIIRESTEGKSVNDGKEMEPIDGSAVKGGIIGAAAGFVAGCAGAKAAVDKGWEMDSDLAGFTLAFGGGIASIIGGTAVGAYAGYELSKQSKKPEGK
jgi:hypothetical protein